MARILTLSQDAMGKWNDAASARHGWITVSGNPEEAGESEGFRAKELEHYAAAMELWAKLRYQIAELDLVAGRPVRDAAHALYLGHGTMAVRLRPAGPQADPLTAAASSKVNPLQEELIVKARADLGLDRGRGGRVRSMLQRSRMLRGVLSHIQRRRPATRIDGGASSL